MLTNTKQKYGSESVFEKDTAHVAVFTPKQKAQARSLFWPKLALLV